MLARLGILAAVVVSAAAAGGVIGLMTAGWTGLAAALTAAGVCLAAGAVALVIAHACRAPNRLLFGVLLGMGVRTIAPLAVAFFVEYQCEGLANAGFLYYLVFFYLLTLAVETALALPEAS
ncbi:MAG: hypothetical protein ACOC46_00410 [Pirellulales bacterium]